MNDFLLKLTIFIFFLFTKTILTCQPLDNDFFYVKVKIFDSEKEIKSTYEYDPTSSHDVIDIITKKRTPFRGTLKEGLANIWQMDTSQIIIDDNPIKIGYSFNYTYAFATDVVNTITNALAYKLDFIVKDSLSSDLEKIYLVKVIDSSKFIKENFANQFTLQHIFDHYEKQFFLKFEGFPYYYFVDYLRQVKTKEGEKYPLRLNELEFSGLYDFYIPEGKTFYDNTGVNFEKYDSYLEMNHYLQKMGIEIQLVERQIPLKVVKFLNTNDDIKRSSRVFK